MPGLNAKRGFSLIEILLSLFFIATIVTILLTTSGSLFTRRKSDQQAIASKAASKEIERLRGLPYSTGSQNLLNQGDLGGYPYTFGSATCTHDTYPGSVYDSNENYLRYLKSGAMCRELYDYANTPPGGGNPSLTTKIVGVKVTVFWKNDQGADQQLTMDTLISENGL